MALDFPDAPTVNQTFVGPNGITWKWDGVKWLTVAGGAVAYAPISVDYLIRTANAALTAGRVVTDGTVVTWDWSVAGQVRAVHAALSGDITTPANSPVTTLATVNANVGTFQGITVNAKGLVTAAVAVTYLQPNVTAALVAGFTATSYNGGTVTGANQTINPTPSSTVQNLQYYTLNGSSLTGTLTIAKPTADCTVVFDLINGGTGAVGATLTTTAWAKVIGDTWAGTAGQRYRFFGSVVNAVGHLNIAAMQ